MKTNLIADIQIKDGHVKKCNVSSPFHDKTELSFRGFDDTQYKYLAHVFNSNVGYVEIINAKDAMVERLNQGYPLKVAVNLTMTEIAAELSHLAYNVKNVVITFSIDTKGGKL